MVFVTAAAVTTIAVALGYDIERIETEVVCRLDW